MEKCKKGKKKSRLFGFLVLGVLALALVSAVTYYALLTFNVIVVQPISVNGQPIPYEDTLIPITCNAGDTCVGNVVTISNSADEDRLISVTVTDSSDDLTTGVVGEVILSEKDSEWVAFGDTATVYYTIIGDKFNYKVDSDTEDYVLVYYPDLNSAKDWNINNAVLIGDADLDWTTLDLADLPVGGDYNIAPDPDYCDFNNGFDDYLHCSNAKFWLMPKADWEAKSWNPTEWLFETDLITYTDSISGTTNVLVPAGGSVSVYPQVTVNDHASGGTYPVNIEVA